MAGRLRLVHFPCLREGEGSREPKPHLTSAKLGLARTLALPGEYVLRMAGQIHYPAQGNWPLDSSLV